MQGFEESVALGELLTALPASRREVFVLTQLLGLTYSEAATVAQCPVGTIRSRVARARGALIAQLTSGQVRPAAAQSDFRSPLRLPVNAGRPGFTAALAFAGPDLVGLATAWTTLVPFPTGRCYPQAAVSLGPDRTVEWQCGAREINELAVRADAQGTGLAAELLEAVTADAPDGRSWLLTSVQSGRAMSFYRRQGWTQATHPASARGEVPLRGDEPTMPGQQGVLRRPTAEEHRWNSKQLPGLLGHRHVVDHPGRRGDERQHAFADPTLHRHGAVDGLVHELLKVLPVAVRQPSGHGRDRLVAAVQHQSGRPNGVLLGIRLGIRKSAVPSDALILASGWSGTMSGKNIDWKGGGPACGS
ncbi:hypothetical protein GCM10009579_72880 [Streptomyces javensis]|uniref:N-acetyltransferase domain-containing protein n=1 Tax=Streptomyces javensis TaxID=114698 RepID=A0ABP4I171_9ACTN